MQTKNKMEIQKQEKKYEIKINKRIPKELKDLQKEVKELQNVINGLSKVFKNIVQKDNVILIELNDNVIIKNKNILFLNEGYNVQVAKEIHLNPNVKTKKLLQSFEKSDDEFVNELEKAKNESKKLEWNKF